MTSMSAFYTNSADVLERNVDAECSKTDSKNITEVYEIARTIDWIKEGKYRRVSLQFPDDLMTDAVAVCTHLEKSVSDTCKIFILGDTSYGSCCVDEVAAQHYNADSLVHYGRSCLSQPCNVPVLYVFGRLPLDVDDCAEKFCVLFPEPESNVIIMYDTVYQYACDDLYGRLQKTYTSLHISKLNTTDQVVQTQETSDQVTVHKCGRVITLNNQEDLSSYSLYYIGTESLTLTNLVYNFQSSQIYSYNPVTKTGKKENVNVNKMLMKRYYMIEKAKDARIVGILVGTLGVANYLDILTRLKSLIKKAGKKSYVFIVGKINVAKLANFMEVDVYVLIACAENSLLDSSEFYKPVITPYEMELACNTERQWTGDYPTQFSQLLEGGSHHVPVPDVIQQDETDISLITGQLRSTGVTNTVETGTSVVLRSDTLTVATTADTAGEYLSQRTWQGLEQKLGETPVTKAVEGQKGIAMGYIHEPQS